MPLSPDTPLILRARLVAPAGTALGQPEVVAHAFALTATEEAPRIVELGRGVPAPDGSLTLSVTLPGVLAGEVHPRIQLTVRPPRVRNPRVIAEIPAGARGATIDFGVIEVRQEALFAIGDTTFFGFSKAVVDRLGGSDLEVLAELRRQIETLSNQARQLSAQLSTVTAQNGELQQSITQLNEEKTRLESQIATLTTQNGQMQRTNNRLRGELDTANQERAAATEAAAAFRVQTEALGGQVGQLNSRVLQLNTQILQLNDQVLTVESRNRALAADRQILQTTNTDLSANLAAAQQERAAAQTTIDDLKESINTRTSLGDLVANVGTELRTAQETLAGSGSPFKLGRLSMELKVVPSQHGTGFNFPTRDEVQRISGDSLSVVNFDFSSVTPVTFPVDPSLVEVPDLAGMTEVMARRVVAAAGLGLQTGLLAVPRTVEGVSQAGRVVRQIPAAGDRVAPGTVITALLGKEE